MVNNLAIEND